jgi:hypothetical protein
MRAQEIPFEKYRDDFHVVITSNKVCKHTYLRYSYSTHRRIQVSLDNISTLYLPVWKALGQRRSEQLEAASTMRLSDHFNLLVIQFRLFVSCE